MKKIIYILIIFLTLLASCKKAEEASYFNKTGITCPGTLQLSDTVYSILKSYPKYLGKPSDVVYVVFIRQTPDSITTDITHIQYIKELENYKPSGYITIDNDLFLFYFGFDLLIRSDTLFDKNLKKAMSRYDLKQNSEPPTLFTSYDWSITYFQKNKRILINKKYHCPFRSIDFLLD